MLALLMKLVPFRDFAYAAIAIAAGLWWIHHDHVEQAAGAARVEAAVAAASAAAQKDAEAKVAAHDNEHAIELAKVKEIYDTAITSAAAQHAADLQRLRDIAARRSNGGGPVLGSAAPAPSGADPGPPSVGGLGEVAAGLADALRQDDASLSSCRAERDSLTGK